MSIYITKAGKEKSLRLYDSQMSKLGVPYSDLFVNTRFVKTQTNVSEDGILLAALSEEDLEKISKLIADLQIVRFDCGHGIHIEKPKEFIECLMNLQ